MSYKFKDDGYNLENLVDQFNDDEFDDLIPHYEDAKENVPADCLECLEKVFGHRSFRDTQWKIISSVMNDKRDNCIVMTTGYGKSLCYQFPSVYLNTVTVVVSPLISLMEDQVLSLKLNNIKACLLGTAQIDKSIFLDIFSFKYNVVYCTPEFLTQDFGLEFLKKLSPKLQLIAIDEAHCISKWGHNFRPKFRLLNIIRSTVPSIPILALTATATEHIRNDICKCLQLNNPQILCTGFDRPNLEFHVNEKTRNGVWIDVGQIVKSVQIGSIIIYCLTRQSTEDICEILQNQMVNCAAYHSGLPIQQRKKIHEDFVKDKLQVIVATIAFGMGIDKPDVRVVIHYGVSKDVESYYQEVGRAGRDGMPARCFMFHCEADWRIHSILTEKSSGSNESKEILNKLSMKMKEYVNILGCRRAYIINYFEKDSSILKKKYKNCCDNCNVKKADENLSDIYENITNDGYYDFSRDAENLFKCIEVFNGAKGLTSVILFLRGAKRQNLNEEHFKHNLFGVGRDKTLEWYKSLAELLELNNYVEKKSIKNSNFSQKNSFYHYAKVISITQKTKAWLNNLNREPILLKPNKSLLKFMKRKTFGVNSGLRIDNTLTAEPSTNDASLIVSLIKIRGAIASQMDVMPYMILSNRAIHQLAQKCPLSLAELKASKLDGFSDAKVDKFGPSFLKCILKYKKYLPENSYEFLSNNNESLINCLADCPLPNTKPLTEILLITYKLFKTGKTVTEIAQERNLAYSTIINYFNEIIRNGLIVNKIELQKLGVTDDNFKIITEKLQCFDLNTVKLSEIKEVCPPTVDYHNIKLVLSYNQLKKHAEINQMPFENSKVVKNGMLNSNKFINDKDAPACSTSIVKEDIGKTISYSHPNTSFSAINIANEQEAAQNMGWDSDDEFDFHQIDNDVHNSNNTLINTISQNSKDKGNNLNLNDIQKVQNYGTGVISEANKINPVKRKINIKVEKSSITYLDDSSEEELENRSHNQLKRRFPE